MVTLNSKYFIVKTKEIIVLETKFVDVFDRDQGLLKKSYWRRVLFEIDKESISLVFLAEGFEIFEKQLDISKDKEVLIILKPLVEVIRSSN